ncbi:MAG: hypothetical protein HY912_10380 [Desulfomonile tiedjei]|uniref:Uncharacterized protein n=1 Tax=Desulfomonile tiedjei TaxID=2358 RepID=A0A9D6V1Q0_9BACT|nr:hypothetical protein [Desulfomonile tiedjei]
MRKITTSPCGPTTKEPGGLYGPPGGPCSGSLETPLAHGFRLNTFQVKAYILALLCVAHFALTFIYIAPGPLLIDEAIYHWMARSFSERGSLDVWNGYEEFPSPELRHRYLRAREGKLVPQYPSLFSVLALPFYRVFGFFGLFVMNSLAFVGVVVICFFTARKLFGDAELALDSCLVLVLATFAWEYSQAAWPHMCALLFAMCAFYLTVSSYFARTRGTSLGLAMASGAIAAIGLGLRLDAILIFPALILPFLFARPTRLREALALGVGSLLPVAVLSAMNEAKFGAFSPFSYGDGPNVQTISPLVCLAAGVVAGLVWIVMRPKPQEWAKRHKIAAGMLMGASLVLSILLVSDAWETVSRVLRDAYVCVVDIRAFPPEPVVAQRSSGGGVLYIGAHKKALLQSLPYLGLLIVPFFRMLRPDKDSFSLALLFVTPVTVIAFFVYSFPFHDTGGLCLNTRYFLLGLPFISILSAYAIRDLKDRWVIPFGFPVMTLIVAATGAVYLLLTQDARGSLDALEYPILVVPLWMAGGFAVAMAAGLALESGMGRAIRAVAWVLLVMTMTWAGLVALTYDYPAHRYARAAHHFYGDASLKAISPDSLLFSDNKTVAASMGAVEKERVRIGFPTEDGFKDFLRLTNFQLNAGRRVFALFQDPLWAELQKGVLSTYRVSPLLIFQGFTLSEIAFPGVGVGTPER